MMSSFRIRSRGAIHGFFLCDLETNQEGYKNDSCRIYVVSQGHIKQNRERFPALYFSHHKYITHEV